MRYPFSMNYMKDADNTYWVAKSMSLKGCIGVGDTQEEALAELCENENAWLETAAEVGIEIPEIEPEEEHEYSGKLSLRISPAIHKKTAELAKSEGISLNQFINDAIVTYSAEIKTAGYISTRVAMEAQNIGDRYLMGKTKSEHHGSTNYSLKKTGVSFKY